MIKKFHPKNVKASLSIRHSQHRRQKGAALVIVLAFVVLLTVLVVAYFSRTQSDNKLSNSSVNQSKSDELAQSALDIIIGDLKQEIVSGSTSLPSPNPGNYPTFYQPTVNTKLVPVRNGVPALVSGKYPIPNLIRISTTTAITSPGVDHPASAALSTASSRNGQSISLSRWNRHYLIPRKNAGSNTIDSTPLDVFTAPSWVYVTNQGPEVLTTTSQTTVGRYAYAIYDEGGLLDVNVAGYPSTLPADSAHPAPDTYNLGRLGYGGKGPSAFADLTQLPPLAALLSSDQAAIINNLVGWRNYATAQASGAFNNFTINSTGAAGYHDAVLSNTNGFLKVNSTSWSGRTDQAFLGRQQLINFITQGISKPATSAGLQNSLQYLGTFSRSLNAPSSGPTINATGAAYQYYTNANADSSINRLFPNVRVTTPFIRTDGSNAKVGDPLVTRRFPLSRVGLVTYTATANTSSDIFKYFGLLRASASSPWIYSNSDGTAATTIKTLKQAADEGREPNFFELLYAGILNGSLGVGGGGGVLPSVNASGVYSPAGYFSGDNNPYFQLIRIGANIIDQYDADNYPTTVTFNTLDFYGIEDIPYPNKILWKFVTSSMAQSPAATPNWRSPMKVEVFFELWNPHQQKTSSANTGPTEFRIKVNSQGQYRVRTVLANATFNVPYTTDGPAGGPYSFMPSGTVVNFNLASAASYREPAVVRQDAATPTGDVSILSFPTTGSKALGFTLNGPSIVTGTWPAAGVKTGVTDAYLLNPGLGSPNGPAQTWFWAYENFQTIFSYQYKNASNVWQTYATSGGYDGFPLSGTQNVGTWVYVNTNPWLSSNVNANQPYSRSDTVDGIPWLKSDPRTFRRGLSVGGTVASYTAVPTPTQGDNPLITSGNKLLTGTGARLDFMSQNRTGVTPGSGTYTPYSDLDAIMRPGDSYLTSAAAVNWENNATASRPPMKSGATLTRPILLNRPFRSVGELGYVYRDMQWKTLDLFSANSADSGLLDIFCINETVSVAAGRVNLNTQNPEVLKALLAGTTTQEAGGITLTATEADNIAKAITASSISNPLLNLQDLANRLASNTTDLTSQNKLEREAVMRALGSSTSTRTWNLLIDVVAQSGKFPPNVSSLNDFAVEGSRRYWMHVAIDRHTGKVIDKQLERVDE